MAGKVVNSNLVLLSKFGASRQECASKTATSHIQNVVHNYLQMKHSIFIFIFTSILVSCKKPLEFKTVSDRPHIEHAINNNSISLFHENFVNTNDEFNELVDQATTLASEGKFKMARDLFDEAMKIDPNDPVLLNNYGNLEHRDKNFSQAIAYFQKSIDVSDNKYIVAYINLGKTYGLIGETEKSEEAYSFALEHTEVPYFKGLTYLHLAQYYLDYGVKEKGLESVLKARGFLKGDSYMENLLDSLENKLNNYN